MVSFFNLGNDKLANGKGDHSIVLMSSITYTPVLVYQRWYCVTKSAKLTLEFVFEAKA